MHTLQLPFKLLTLTGIWIPEHWNTIEQKVTWVFFSIICIGLVFVQFSTLVGYMLLSRTWAEFSERLFFIPTGVSSLQKIFVFLTRRRDLINLDRMLMKDCCVPRTAEEVSIQGRYDEIIRSVTLACALLVNVTMLNLVSLPFLSSLDNRTLPLKVWLPYSVNSDFSYWFSYAHQTVGIIVIGTGAVGSTLMINGFVYQICAQFQLLSHRFYKLTEIVERLRTVRKPDDVIRTYEQRILKQNIQHHLYIFKLAETINNIFKSVIFQQFLMSAFVVSINIYQLSTRPEKDLEFMMVLFYLICVLVEFFVYCWFANELMLESLNFHDVVYDIDWTVLTPSTGRDLIFIAMRATKPIIIYCGHFFVLSLESYIGILKVSYSVFNILNRSSD